jgi:hypothetical protein
MYSFLEINMFLNIAYKLSVGTASFSMGIFSPGVPLLQGVEVKEKTSCCMAFILAGSFMAKRAQVVALLTYYKIVKRSTYRRENTLDW